MNPKKRRYSSGVNFEIDPRRSVAYITIPERVDTQEIFQDSATSIETAGDDQQIKVIVLRRSGRDFWSEKDEAKLPHLIRMTKLKKHLWDPASLFGTIADCKKVIVTPVQGQCFGVGFSLNLLSDITIAEESALFGFFTGENGAMTLPNPVLLIRCIGWNRTKAWVFDRRPWTATQAERYGLINAVFPESQINTAINELVDDIRRLPLDGIVVGKTHLETILNELGAPAGSIMTMDSDLLMSLTKGARGGGMT